MTDFKPSGQNLHGEFPKLADFLCFATYSANLAFSKIYKPYLTELGLTYTQWITMLALAEDDGQAVNQLGEKLFLASSTLTPLLKNLENRGIVLRQRSKEDERKVQIFLTEKGRELYNASYRCMELFHSLGLTQEEARALQNAIVKLRDNLLLAVNENP
ncbi:MarR family transcriptional regulator [Escherichia coli]|nr:MarR family transcriptional regulator [Escherichia coli]MCM7070635.1 MarR family transcriptional regulator [Enterobacter hormaechei]EFL7417198.1 MarR family transcriptional regulator [Escherichia coli]EFN4127090.1 MarR family transcriptional regulator [Escherichia coli]ELC3362348.1 MarR family transcriptional regulator [Escherichia coli]